MKAFFSFVAKVFAVIVGIGLWGEGPGFNFYKVISVILWIYAISPIFDKLFSKPKVKPEISEFWELEREILNACWNESSSTFDWKVWFDRRDEIIHTAPEIVLKDLDFTLRSYGEYQIYYINAILGGYSSNPSGTIRRIKSIEQTIILDLASMYSFKNGECDSSICPEEVTLYRQNLYDIIYGRIDVNEKKIESIIQLGVKATHQ